MTIDTWSFWVICGIILFLGSGWLFYGIFLIRDSLFKRWLNEQDTTKKELEECRVDIRMIMSHLKIVDKSPYYARLKGFDRRVKDRRMKPLQPILFI